jgi:prepilin-type N-terminal cleavage/methylation domain-containing protein
MIVPTYRRRGTRRGFSLLEVIFAIAMLSIGIIGILSLFTTGISLASDSANLTAASMEAQSLLTRILSETRGTGVNAERVFLKKINPGTKEKCPEYIQATFSKDGVKWGSGKEPVLIDPDRDYWWVCRVKPVRSDYRPPSAPGDAPAPVNKLWRPPFDPVDPLDLAEGKQGSWKDNASDGDVVTGLYEVAIGIWKNYGGGYKHKKKPIVVYTAFVSAGY